MIPALPQVVRQVLAALPSRGEACFVQGTELRSASPELDLERLRLERDVALKSQVFVTLTNQAEIARVEEAKNMPIVRVLDRAVVPELPVRVPKVTQLAAGGLGGLVLAALLVAAIEFLRSLRAEAARA